MLDGTNKGVPSPLAWERSGEWRTLLLIMLNYAGWLLLTLYWQDIPVPLLALGGAFCLGLFGSLQHEAIHGHPTRSRRVNLALVVPPLWLWLPLRIYDESHRLHHEVGLTLPGDPESWYLVESHWQRRSAMGRLVLTLNQTLAGRLILGPWISAYRVWRDLLFGAKPLRTRLWTILTHVLGVAVIFLWLAWVEMPLYLYVLAFAWPGSSLAMVRSFMEHRYDDDEARRTIIVRGCPLTRLLFLNNNFHVVHHTHPSLPWYRVAAEYYRNRHIYDTVNGGFTLKGYWSMAGRYLFRPWTTRCCRIPSPGAELVKPKRQL